MTTMRRLSLALLALLTAIQPSLAQSHHRNALDFDGLLGLQRQHVTPSNPDRSNNNPPMLGKSSAKTYKFSTVDYPGGDYSGAVDTNGTTVVGFFQYTTSSPFSSFSLSSGAYRILSVPGAVGSQALGINTSGQITGSYTDSSNVVHGFLDTQGVFTTIDYPGATNTAAVYDINDGGVMVGTYVDAANVDHGFTDNAGSFTSIDYPGATNTITTGINTAGEIVGVWTDASSVAHSFLLNGGVYTSLDYPTATSTEAVGINDSNEISGHYFDSANNSHGFIYSNGTWTQVDVAGASSTQVFRIENNGRIVGEYTDDRDEWHGIQGH